MKKNRFVKSFIASLYCLDNGVPKPLKVITWTPGFFSHSGKVVLGKSQSQGWRVREVDIKFHVSDGLAENSIFRVSCATDIDGLLYDVLCTDHTGDFWFANDMWNNPEDFDLGAVWEKHETGGRVQFNGKSRKVFAIKNIGYKRWVTQVNDHLESLCTEKDGKPALFITGDFRDIEYY